MGADMDARTVGDPVRSRFRAALEEAYGDRLDRAMLFGSRARGITSRILITMWPCSFAGRTLGSMRSCAWHTSTRRSCWIPGQ